MKKTTPASDRTTLRHSLLTNGYEPLPLHGKACYVQGWSFCPINTAFIDEHARRGLWRNTGLRCGHVVAIDIDVDHQEYADALDALVEECLGPTTFCRFGKGEKRVLLYRNDTPIPKRTTHKYRYAQLRNNGEATGDIGTAQVEILGTGNQFCAFGIHPDTKREYEWPADSPLTHSLDALPVVTPDQLGNLRDTLERWFRDHGDFTLKPGTAVGTPENGESAHDYCLTPDSVFEVLEPAHGMMSVVDIDAQLGAHEEWQCNLTAIRPSSDSGAGRIVRGANGRVQVHDFVTGITFMESLQLDEEGAVLADLLPADLFDGNGMDLLFPDPQQQLRKLLKECVYVAFDGSVRFLDEPTRGYKRDHFNTLYNTRVLDETGTPVSMGTAWARHSQCKKAVYAELRPDQLPGLFTHAGKQVLNLYVPPQHSREGAQRGEIRTYMDFMMHLVPDARERRIVLDWLANKIQRPWMRQHALVMVAANVFGTGRGTFWDIAAQLIGEDYCVETTLTHLTGSTGQAQYNDYLSQALLVTIPEAMQNEDMKQGRWYARRQVYEHIKTVADTGTRKVLIRRKGTANKSETVYSSIGISTNHNDGIAIEPGDRRLVVVENTRTMLADAPNDLHDRIHTWRANPDNIAALYYHLAGCEIEYDATGIPPTTKAKARMIESNQSGLEQAWALFVEQAKGDVCTSSQWRAFAQQAKREYDLDFPESHQLDKVLESIISAHCVRVVESNMLWQVRLENARVRPWILRNFERWQWANDAVTDPPGLSHHLARKSPDADFLTTLKREILRNGDPGGAVVQLPQR